MFSSFSYKILFPYPSWLLPPLPSSVNLRIIFIPFDFCEIYSEEKEEEEMQILIPCYDYNHLQSQFFRKFLTAHRVTALMSQN